MTNIFIDSNVWDWLIERDIDLVMELPPNEFRFFITREAEFEIPSMPPEKREYARKTIKQAAVATDAYFGFGDDSLPPDKQRAVGFDQGRFITYAETDFIQEQAKKRSAEAFRPTGLKKHEADISLGARAMHSVVLTLDKKGALADAKKLGGKVVFLGDFEKSGLSLRDYILSIS